MLDENYPQYMLNFNTSMLDITTEALVINLKYQT
jgi:hypothetical protein